MKRYKTEDGHHVYVIKRNRKSIYLADQTNYQMEINRLIETLDDLKFDSVIFFFGLDTGDYLKDLKEKICSENKVYIIEPNKAIYKKTKKNWNDSITLISFDLEKIKMILQENIHGRNFTNIYFYAFGNYKSIYKNKYDTFIELLDDKIMDASVTIGLSNRFREVFLQNMIANIKIISNSSPMHHYIHTNKNVPAFIVSAGPSLDKNIEELKKHQEKLSQSIIIAGSRSVGALVKNHIVPDLIVSIDPVDANYEMMEDFLELTVPLAFYENSNRYLLRDYKGDKVYVAELFPHIIEECKELKGLYLGGSVAHSCIDFATMLGCSPIFLLGQDFAHTDSKHHATNTIYNYDNNFPYLPELQVKDVFGKPIFTTYTLNAYRHTLEEYIQSYQKETKTEFINCSYGADIAGAPFQELSDAFKQTIFRQVKTPLVPIHDIQIPEDKIISSMLLHMEESLNLAEGGLGFCDAIIKENQTKSLLGLDETDVDLRRFHTILKMIEEFEHRPESQFLGGYFNKFLYDIKINNFSMYASDYESLTSDLQYQARVFRSYFAGMKEMLLSAKELAQKTVDEFYK